MKIWIDLRFISDDLYSKFIIQLIEELIKKERHNEYIIYANWIKSSFENDNVIVKNINIKIWSFSEQTKYLRILKKDKNSLMIFFNHYKPIFYKEAYITFVWSLKNIYYMNFNSYIKKYKFLFLMNKNFKKSQRLICFDQNTKNELIEKFDIEEERIKTIKWFFPEKREIKNEQDTIDINIRAKYSITKDFFIYSWWDSIEKNYEKLISVFSRLREEWKDYAIVFLGHNISTNLNLRNLILETDMQKNVYFLWKIPELHKKYLYSDCLWTIFPSFYEPFPFNLYDPMFYKSHIISSDLKSIKDIFWDKISYFSPISANSIYITVKDYLEKWSNTKKIDYFDILSKYNKENTIDNLVDVIS